MADKAKALRVYSAQSSKPLKADQCLRLSAAEFIDEVEKGIAAADEHRLVDHQKLKALWEARRVQITEIVT